MYACYACSQSGGFRWNERADGNTLTITEATTENSGIFSCVASNPYGQSHVDVSVRVRPVDSTIVFAEGPEFVTAQVGSDVTLECSVCVSVYFQTGENLCVL